MSNIKNITIIADESTNIRMLFALAKSSVCPLGEEYCTGCGHISDEHCAVCINDHIDFIRDDKKY